MSGETKSDLDFSSAMSFSMWVCFGLEMQEEGQRIARAAGKRDGV